MIRKKILIPLIVAIFCTISLSVVLFYLGNNLELTKNNEKIELNISKGLTSRQRLKDFKEICTVLENCMPSLFDYAEVYGINYDELKQVYKEKIKKCPSDYEYYYLITGFLNCIPNCHTYLFNTADNPLYSKNIGIISPYDNIFSAVTYWDEISKTVKSEYSENKSLVATYVDNNYFISNCEKSIDEYVTTVSSMFRLQYDFVNNVPYRPFLLFNDKTGTPCRLKIQLSNGEIKECDVYGDAEWALFRNSAESDTKQETEQNTYKSDYSSNEIITQNFYSYRDEEINLAYLYIDNFSNQDGPLLQNALDSYDNIDNVIIDLRQNSGGYSIYAPQNIYPKLFAQDITYSAVKYITKNDYSYINDLEEVKEIPFPTVFDEMVYEKVSIDYKGNHHTSKNVTVLVSQITASAADNFSSLIKENKLGTLIGNNTGGEGFCNPQIYILKQSGLAIRFSDGMTINSDGTSNSVYGTAPDIYAELSVDGYKKMQQLIADGQDPYTYENLLKWDDVLIKTLEIIKEKESSK